MNDVKERINAQKVFDNVIDKALISDKEPDKLPVEYASDISPLAAKLKVLFEEYERDRKLTEDRWIEDLRQFRGEYKPEDKAKMHPKRSKAFLSLTRTKVKTISARESDLLFPANGEKNWSIKPSPVPELNPTVVEDIMMQYQQQTGEQASPEMIKKFINQEAVSRSDAMEKEMADQLSELKYRAIVRNVILSGNLYGTGILKGPLGKTKVSKRWMPHGEEWVPIELKKLKPYCEFVPIWDVYPDMSARTPDEMRGVFQRYLMNRNQVYELAKRDDFNGDLIIKYLKGTPNGDAEYRAHEHNLKNLNDANSSDGSFSRHGKYELKEFWGYLSADELIAEGVQLDEEQLGLEIAANVWMLGPLVIKAVVSPIEGVSLPYHFYYYDKDDSSIWGEGIPTIMRDAQKLFNASVRAMLDNAAISAGPVIEANMDLLDPSENPKDLYPFRVFLREGVGAEATAPAIRVTSLPSYTNEFMNMINFFMTASDEVTAIPRYMYGDTNQVGGAGKTATGLSMLMGAANVTLKDQIKNFDDGITVPFIKALYFWNMDFNEKEFIKGDFNVVARGSSSLIAREVKSESLMQFMQTTNNPTDMMYTKRDNILREYAGVLDLDELDLIKDTNTVAMEEKARSQQQEEEQAFMRELAMIKATSGGHMEPNPQQAAQGAGMQPDMEPLSPTDLQQGSMP